MIFEYALEPALVATWREPEKYRYFVDKFGLGTPRVMGAVPKFSRWRTMVIDAAGGPEAVDSGRLTAILGLLAEARVARVGGKPYEDNAGWLANALEEHGRVPFHAILAEHNPDWNGAVITGASIGDTPEPRWDKDGAATVPREAAELAGAVADMLSNCSKAIFVDPYFQPDSRRHLPSMQAFFNALFQSRGGQPPTRIEVHTNDRMEAGAFRLACEQQMAPIIPQGVLVCFVRWRERHPGEKLHHRYILTNLGGVSFQYGLDQDLGGSTEDIRLLARDQYEFRWNQYAGAAPAFDRADGSPVCIRGSARGRA